MRSIKTLNKKILETKATNRIYINTLEPNFSYNNKNGDEITPKNCINL